MKQKDLIRGEWYTNKNVTQGYYLVSVERDFCMAEISVNADGKYAPYLGYGTKAAAEMSRHTRGRLGVTGKYLVIVFDFYRDQETRRKLEDWLLNGGERPELVNQAEQLGQELRDRAMRGTVSLTQCWDGRKVSETEINATPLHVVEWLTRARSGKLSPAVLGGGDLVQPLRTAVRVREEIRRESDRRDQARRERADRARSLYTAADKAARAAGFTHTKGTSKSITHYVDAADNLTHIAVPVEEMTALATELVALRSRLVALTPKG